MANITCKKTGSNKSISLGTTYEVISENETRYIILNDKGIEAKYCKSLFDVVKENRRRPAQERQAPAPAPVPVRIIDSFEVVTNANIADNGIASFSVNISENGNQVTSLNTANSTVHGTNISCGVYQFSGITNLCDGINAIQGRLQNYCRNANNTRLDQNFDFEELKANIFEALIQDLLEQKANVSAFMLISTNEGSIADIYSEKLNEMSASTTEWVRNRNSGNDIKVWCLETN